MRSEFYVPVLKSKEGEFRALLKLEHKLKKFVYPLFEITPIEWDSETKTKAETLDEHLIKFCKKYKKYWRSSNAFIDTQLVDDIELGNVCCYEFIFHRLASRELIPIVPVPVLCIKSHQRVLNGIPNLVSKYGVVEVALKLTIDDISSMNFFDNVNNLLEKIAFRPNSCHLILDLKAANFDEVDLFVEVILSHLEEFPHFSKWKTFTICGGSFPKTGAIKEGVHQIPRNEWKFYKKLISQLKEQEFFRNINYGDYSIIAPGHFEFDPVKMKTSANIRYTHNDIWYVIKGKALKKRADWDQYIIQAQNIVNSSFYLNENFCEGDLRLFRCSIGKESRGSSGVWNWVGNNHHFTKVVNDLFSNQLSS